MPTTTRQGRAAKLPTIGAMQYAAALARLHGCGRAFEPVECWTVQADRPVKVRVVMVHGHCDNYKSSHDYAETADRDTISARYLFPARTHKRPTLATLSDDYGSYRDWTSDAKK